MNKEQTLGDRVTDDKFFLEGALIRVASDGRVIVSPEKCAEIQLKPLI